MTYLEKLKDPRWQKKRLEILNRDHWTCQKCNCNSKTLHVHHRNYLTGHEPWEYDEVELVTLCFECHEEEELYKKEANNLISQLRSAGLFNTEIMNLFNPAGVRDRSNFDRKIILELFDYSDIEGFVNDLRDVIIKHCQIQESIANEIITF